MLTIYIVNSYQIYCELLLVINDRVSYESFFFGAILFKSIFKTQQHTIHHNVFKCSMVANGGYNQLMYYCCFFLFCAFVQKMVVTFLGNCHLEFRNLGGKKSIKQIQVLTECPFISIKACLR